MSMYYTVYLQILPLITFCFLAWWVHRSSQWRVGRPATWGGTVRLVLLNVLLLVVFGLGFMIWLTSLVRQPASFLGAAFIAFMPLVVAPIISGSIILAFSGHASFRHSFIGMTLSYIGVIVLIGSEIMEGVFAAYLSQDMVWQSIDWSLLPVGYIGVLPFYFLLFTTGGYVISEWLEYKRG